MIFNLIVFILALFINISFIIFLLKSNEYSEYVEGLDDSEFPLKDVYGAGFVLADKLKIDYKSSVANDLRQQVSILYGDKYCEYYIRVLYAQKLSLTWLTFAAGSLIAAMASGQDCIVVFLIAAVMAGAVYYYFSQSSKEKIKKKSIIYLTEFPNVVSTLALLVNAGMILREAWTEVAYSSEGAIYEQMRIVSEDMENGMSEGDALYAFSLRCATPEIKKFTALIVQGLQKGNEDLSVALKGQSDEMWELKKQNVLQRGDLAASKLLIPIMIMFIGILIIVMGPIMANLGV